jgi:FAD binding domain in molybdopterin dehydrogenase
VARFLRVPPYRDLGERADVEGSTPFGIVALSELTHWYSGEMPASGGAMIALTQPTLAVHRSRKLIPEFRLHRPNSAAEAVTMMASSGPGAAYMAGGIDIINRMKFGAPVTDLIHLGHVAGLDGIDEEGDGLRVGAL